MLGPQIKEMIIAYLRVLVALNLPVPQEDVLRLEENGSVVINKKQEQNDSKIDHTGLLWLDATLDCAIWNSYLEKKESDVFNKFTLTFNDGNLHQLSILRVFLSLHTDITQNLLEEIKILTRSGEVVSSSIINAFTDLMIDMPEKTTKIFFRVQEGLRFRRRADPTNNISIPKELWKIYHIHIKESPKNLHLLPWTLDDAKTWLAELEISGKLL